jgi:tRNA (guanine-N7-)-methyltransferase
MSDGLYITRKRKKWKFHHFNEWSNCWQTDDITPKDITKFANKSPLTIEIGAGTADLSTELARRYPDERFIACDIKSDRLYTGAKQALAEKRDNIRFLRMNMRQLSEVFSKSCATTIWITFPDPFPRKRSAKHRLTHPLFLKMYETMLKNNGNVKFKTDNRVLFDWSLEQFKAEGWKIEEVTRDLHNTDVSDDYKITTAFERKFITAGLKTNFFRATPPGTE